MHSYINDKIKTLANCIKIGGLRLGKSFLFISANDKYRMVYLLSADSKVTPGFD